MAFSYRLHQILDRQISVHYALISCIYVDMLIRSDLPEVQI
jgi:hypothetical protein